MLGSLKPLVFPVLTGLNRFTLSRIQFAVQVFPVLTGLNRRFYAWRLTTRRVPRTHWAEPDSQHQVTKLQGRIVDTIVCLKFSSLSR